MLYLVDLEPIEKRYTKQWKTWIPDMIQEYDDDIPYTEISGVSREFKTGEFLDINRTNMYKADQVQAIAELFDENKVNDDDVFLFYDGWHFGVTALKYMAQLQDIDIHIYSIWHAGSYDPWDFTALKGLGHWAQFVENGWFVANDGIFVATQYHKDLITQNRVVFSRNDIHVTGLPFRFDYIDDYDTSNKENIVVFPHRKAPEKSPKTFQRLSELLPEYEFIITMDHTQTKEEYYNLLSKAKVVFSANRQETWGIGTFEALGLGCYPVVPNRLSYSEMYDDAFKYNDFLEAIEMIHTYMNDYTNPTYVQKKHQNFQRIKEQYTTRSIEYMLQHMGY